ncbi:tyrosine-type recombinase/integrase [Psychromonas arctica]|uniref:tyrosine-type recombinase/integrase n=1 Tax=Psychromonas arctica TaxID=168275 RepID=UPI002FD66906
MNKRLETKIKNTKGVSVHNGSLRLQFRLPGAQTSIRKTLGLVPTDHNLNVANNRLGAIKTDIASGLYDINPKQFWRKHFPTDTSNLSHYTTVGDYIDYYKQLREGELSFSIQSKMKSLKTWLTKHKLINKEVISLSHLEIESAIKNSLKTLKQSTVDDYTILFKRIIQEAVNDGSITISPFSRVRRIKSDEMYNVKEQTIPFTQGELKRLLAVVHVEQTKEMIQFLAWTGMRPGEMKALAWEDIDLKEGIAHVKYNINRQGQLKPPKTKSGIRKIELLPLALDVLKRQRSQTYLIPPLIETVHYKLGKTQQVIRRRVFLSRENKPFKRPELSTVPKQWADWLRQAKLIHREPYQLRHTFASQMLMIGADPIWLAKQLGHTDWGMIRKIYGKWIPNERPEYRNELAEKLGQLKEAEKKQSTQNSNK